MHLNFYYVICEHISQIFRLSHILRYTNFLLAWLRQLDGDARDWKFLFSDISYFKILHRYREQLFSQKWAVGYMPSEQSNPAQWSSGPVAKNRAVYRIVSVFNQLSILMSISLVCKVSSFQTLALVFFCCTALECDKELHRATLGWWSRPSGAHAARSPVLARRFDEEIHVLWKGSFWESRISQNVCLEYFYDMGRFWGKSVIPQACFEFSLVELYKQASSGRRIKWSLPFTLLNWAIKSSLRSIFLCNNFHAVTVSSKLSLQFLT